MSIVEASVTRLTEIPEPAQLEALLGTWAIAVKPVAPGETIPGSYWGEPEAGIVHGTLWVRGDTPVHSALHEAAHLICMGAERRELVTRDAAGDDPEECAVCYLSVLLADALRGYDRGRMFADMDAWGYSFRLGTSAQWFCEDAADAREWLLAADLIKPSLTTGMETLSGSSR